MKRNRFWIEIIALGTMIACVVALLIATLGAGAAAVSGPQDISSATPQTSPGDASPLKHDGPAQTFEGMVTCSRCGAKHLAKLDRAASNCALVCVRGGAAFALVDGEKVYRLDGNLGVLKKFAGERAAITGYAHGNTIEVSSVASLAAAR